MLTEFYLRQLARLIFVAFVLYVIINWEVVRDQISEQIMGHSQEIVSYIVSVNLYQFWHNVKFKQLNALFVDSDRHYSNCNIPKCRSDHYLKTS